MFTRQLALLAFVWTAVAAAEDRVVLQPAGTSSRVTVAGRIEDFTGRELTLVTGVAGGMKRYSFAEVVEITTTYTEAHQRGRKELEEGRVNEAWESLTAAMDDEDRGWVRREILALQIQCAYRQGAYSRAATRFLAIAQADPVSPHYRLIPLVWTESLPPGMQAADARPWLVSEALPARLIGASWLLTGTDAVAARQTMLALATDSHPYIQRLAQAQLWRLRLADGNLAAAEVRRWEQLNDEWPEVLRAGPYFLIGRGYADRQEWLLSAAVWMWLPAEYLDRRDLAIEAQFRAANALASAGDASSAMRLAQELTVRFADTPQAVEARQLIERLNATLPSAKQP